MVRLRHIWPSLFAPRSLPLAVLPSAILPSGILTLAQFAPRQFDPRHFAPRSLPLMHFAPQSHLPFSTLTLEHFYPHILVIIILEVKTIHISDFCSILPDN